MRQLLAETRAEVLEEVIKNEQLDKEQAAGEKSKQQSKLASSIGASSCEEVSEASEPDELTTYEKGVQKKFNSVSSSISSNSSSVGGGGGGAVLTVSHPMNHDESHSHPTPGDDNGDTNQKPLIIHNVKKTVEKVEANPVQITEDEGNLFLHL